MNDPVPELYTFSSKRPVDFHVHNKVNNYFILQIKTELESSVAAFYNGNTAGHAPRSC